MIARKTFSKLRAYLASFPCVGIVGSRQVGKTTLVKMLQQVFPNPSQYIDLELPEDRLKLSDPALYLSRFSEQLIIIDEVQLMPELFPILRSLIDQNRRPARFLLLGSASPMLLSSSGESLAGRIVYIELNPLIINEIGEENWESHWLKGGYPEAYISESPISWIWRNSFLQTYQTRDLLALNMNVSPIFLDRLTKMLAAINGELLNESMIAKSLGVSSKLIGNYIDFLENSYFIRRLYSYSANVRKRLVKTPKLYFRDTGLLHRIVGIQNTDDLYNYPQVGNSFESYAVQQILSALNDNITPYFYRTADGSEIDLVLIKGIQPWISIEIKLSNSPKINRGNSLSIIDLGTKHNFILTPSAGHFPVKDNVWITDLKNIWQALQQLDVLV